MNIASPEKKLMRRRVFLMILTIVVLIVGATFGWYYLANQVHVRVDAQVERLAGQGKTLNCENKQVKGYPFRVGLFCEKISYESPAEKIALSAGELRSAAQFYQPGFVVGELDGPAQLKMPGIGDLDLNWKLARSSSNISLGGLKRVSVTVEDFKAKGASGIMDGKLIADLASLELHIRPGGGDAASADIEVALDGKTMRLGGANADKIPAFDLDIDGVAFGLNPVVKSGQNVENWVKSNGLTLQVRQFVLALENGGQLKASGPIQVNTEGLIDGKLDLEISELQTVVENITQQMPELGDTAKTIQAATAIFSQGSKDGKVRFKIQIRRGVMTMGFIPLGVLPPLF